MTCHILMLTKPNTSKVGKTVAQLPIDILLLIVFIVLLKPKLIKSMNIFITHLKKVGTSTLKDTNCRFNCETSLTHLINTFVFVPASIKGEKVMPFASWRMKRETGNDHDYKVAFVSFKEKKKLRLHITTAHPLEQPLGKIKKIRFFVIAHNTLYERKLNIPK